LACEKGKTANKQKVPTRRTPAAALFLWHTQAMAAPTATASAVTASSGGGGGGFRRFVAGSVNWFPGHMARATRLMREQLGRGGVDVVLEVRDARVPFSSANPALEAELAQRQLARVVLLHKADLTNHNLLPVRASPNPSLFFISLIWENRYLNTHAKTRIYFMAYFPILVIFFVATMHFELH